MATSPSAPSGGHRTSAPVACVPCQAGVRAREGGSRAIQWVTEKVAGSSDTWLRRLKFLPLSWCRLLIPLALCSPSLGYQSPPAQQKGQSHLYNHTPPPAPAPCSAHEHLPARPGLLHHGPARVTLKHCQVRAPCIPTAGASRRGGGPGGISALTASHCPPPTAAAQVGVEPEQPPDRQIPRGEI